jgi:putative transposase
MPKRQPIIHRKNYNTVGDAHELTFSTFNGYQFLRADRTCEWLADAIRSAKPRIPFDLWAFVFMPEHAHLLIRPQKPDYDIATIRKFIKAPVARKAIAYLAKESPDWLTKITRQRGSESERLFWQSGGGFDRNVNRGKTLLLMIDYIHNNPVRRGLVEKATDYYWSSAAHYAGGVSPIAIDPIPWDWLEDT